MRLNEIIEVQRIERLTEGLPRSDMMVNRIHCSDSEILDMGDPNYYLALTTDTVVEEIESGLYDDPFQMGWMVVAVNMSDLAAIGAKPIGILLSHTIPQDWKDEHIDLFKNGILSSCLKHDCPVLGGDLNTGPASFTGTGVGRVEKDRTMSRMGCSKGDIIYTTGPPGIGTAYSVSKLLMKDRKGHPEFLPTARIREGRYISSFASSCIDTSDGLLSALDTLSRINEIPMRLEMDLLKLHDSIDALAKAIGLPPISFTFSIHGDFELLFTIPPERECDFLKGADRANVHPIRIGICPTEGCGEGIYIDEKNIPTDKIRNLWDTSKDIDTYASSFIKLIGEIFDDI